MVIKCAELLTIVTTRLRETVFISIKFPLHKQSEILKCAANQDNLLLATLRYAIPSFGNTNAPP